MLRGEFITGRGEVIPNNITVFGADSILKAAMANIAPTFWVGLCDGVASPTLQVGALQEPTIGVNGYNRIQIARSTVGWPNSGQVNNEPYIESLFLTWAAVGGNFNKQIRRLMIVPTQTGLTGNVFALSAPLPALRTITPTTPLVDRQFRYRIYLR